MDALDKLLARRSRTTNGEGGDSRNEGGNNGGRNVDEDSSHGESENEEVGDNDDDDSDNDDDGEEVTLPKDPWSPLLQVRARELGQSHRTYADYKFRANCGASVNLVQRLKKQSQLENHEGCVNALHFNQSGNNDRIPDRFFQKLSVTDYFQEEPT